jgi:uncharacterized OB-fold protein
MSADGFSVQRDEISTPFFDAASEGRLLIRRCARCGGHYPPHLLRCADGTELTWFASRGVGTLVTWAVDHARPLDPTLAAPDGMTSVVGVVELEDGVWVNAAIVGVDPTMLVAGVQLDVHFVRPGGGEPVPVFSPLGKELQRDPR